MKIHWILLITRRQTFDEWRSNISMLISKFSYYDNLKAHIHIKDALANAKLKMPEKASDASAKPLTGSRNFLCNSRSKLRPRRSFDQKITNFWANSNLMNEVLPSELNKHRYSFLKHSALTTTTLNIYFVRTPSLWWWWAKPPKLFILFFFPFCWWKFTSSLAWEKLLVI